MHDTMDSTSAPTQTPHAAHGTTISAAALAARIVSLEAECARLTSERDEARQDAIFNRQAWHAELRRKRALSARVGELERAIQEAIGLSHPGAVTMRLRAALGDEPAPEPPRALDPPACCTECGLPLYSGHIRDEVVIRHVVTGRTRSTHRACADGLLTQGWELVLQARGGE